MARERVRKDRQAKGARLPSAKLTEEAVNAIRRSAEAESQAVLAARFGVSQVAISQVLRGVTWKHVR